MSALSLRLSGMIAVALLTALVAFVWPTDAVAWPDAVRAAGPRIPRHVQPDPNAPQAGFLSKTKSAFSGFTDRLRGSDEDSATEKAKTEFSRSTAETERARVRQAEETPSPLRRLFQRDANGKPGSSKSAESREQPVANAEPVRSRPTAPPVFDPVASESAVPVDRGPVFEGDMITSGSRPAARQPVAQPTLQQPHGGLPPTVSQQPGRARIPALGYEMRRNPPELSSRRVQLVDGEGLDPTQQIRIPINDLPQGVRIGGSDDRISLQVNDAPLSEVLALVAQQHGLNIVTGTGVDGNVTISLSNTRLEDALDAILTVNGYTWVKQNDIVVVSRVDKEMPISAIAQGRVMRVFPLTYVASADVDTVVQGLLSPVGQSFVTTASVDDQRRTREQIVVEDLPEYVARVDAYISEIDHPPMQVLIEARVLRVDLDHTNRHGVNFAAMLQLADADVTLRTTGFANPAASPAFFFGIDGGDLDALVEALETTTDARTLASPRVLAVNGQEARIQIGQRLGYLVTTTTQTSTLQSVNFLDTGIVMTVTPVISADGRIMMTVMPKVSSGRVNPDTGLPEEETTDVQSTVMLDDGQAMIIGGLISEVDVDSQSKIPIAGDLWLVGRLFQRRQVTRERSEIVIALIPRIVPYHPEYQATEDMNILRANTPLTEWPLNSHPRPFEPTLPDATENPRHIRYKRLLNSPADWKCEYPKPAEYYFPSTLDPWYHDLEGEGDE